MSGAPVLRIGTRRSPLALWQAKWVRARLAERGGSSSLVEIDTLGDSITETPLWRFGTPAVFSAELDRALLDGRIDLAVHSLKDLPTQLPEGIMIAAVSAREDPRDALVGRGSLQWADLPPEATVATSSLRRRAQLLHARPDLRIADLRGNVDTRLAKLDATPEWTAVLLAVAGLIRLGRAGRIGERLPLDLVLPAPGQGALAVTVRDDDSRVAESVRVAVEDRSTRFSVSAERGFLSQLDGGCQVPIAAYSQVVAGGDRPVLHTLGRIVSLDGVHAVNGSAQGPVTNEGDADAMGRRLAETLLRQGGAEILATVRPCRSNDLSERTEPCR